MRILAIDDQMDNLISLTAMLRGFLKGCETLSATSGPAGIALAREACPDTILLDIQMPGMDGFQVCKILKNDPATQHIPVIFLTAQRSDSATRIRALEIGGDAFLTKPIEPGELMAQVRAMVRIKVAEDALRADKLSLERIVAERTAELRESEERFRTIFNEAPLGIALLGAESGQIHEMNTSLSRILGRPPSDVLGQDWSSFLHPADIQRPGLDAAGPDWMSRLGRGAADGLPMQSRLLRPDDSVVWVNMIVAPVILTTLESQVCYLCMFEDITAIRQAQAEKEQIEATARQHSRLEAIGTLASGVAHEINNPLTVIMNYGQLIEDSCDDPMIVRTFAANLVKEGERVAGIVKNLLGFARADREAQSDANMADIVQDTVSLVQSMFRKERISLICDVPGDLPRIHCHYQQVQQVLMNLLTNARDAVNASPVQPDHRVIQVSTCCIERQNAQWLRLTVEDHGCGIQPDVAGQVFDPFFTTKPRDQGTGLGLSISYGIVRDHHGNLWFETEPGQGTRFHVELPTRTGESAGQRACRQ